jgi:hypothetical protein
MYSKLDNIIITNFLMDNLINVERSIQLKILDLIRNDMESYEWKASLMIMLTYNDPIHILDNFVDKIVGNDLEAIRAYNFICSIV